MRGVAVVCVLLLACIAGVAANRTVRTVRDVALFHDWARQHGREAQEARLDVWLQNHALIERHNADPTQTFRVAHNQFSDLTHEEWRARFSPLPPATNVSVAPRILGARAAAGAEVDWRTAGAVSPVADQGSCGSCWTFSATGAIEGFVALDKGTDAPTLSKQQLLDCDHGGIQGGCGGGNPGLAQLYGMDAGGLELESAYPYRGARNWCRHVRGHGVVPAYNTVYMVREGDEASLAQIVQTVGPVSVGIDASGPLLRFYSGGLYREPGCSTTALDHAVLVVGLGHVNGSASWTVRNSWGINWGDDGYVHMARNAGNACGIATMATFPSK